MNVCVIGAGVIGTTAAYGLARQGVQVTLLEEKPDVAAGASYANGGQLSYKYVSPLAQPSTLLDLPGWLMSTRSPLRFRPQPDPLQWRWLLRFMAACRPGVARATTQQLLLLSALSRNTLHDWITQDCLPFTIDRPGKLVVYRNSKSLKQAAQAIGLQADSGMTPEILTTDEAISIAPALKRIRDKLAGAIFTADEEVADCRAFTHTLAHKLRSLPGSNVTLSARVHALRTTNGRAVAAVSEQGEIEADHFVVATGVDAHELLRPLGFSPIMYPLKGYSLTLKPKPELGPASVTDFDRRTLYAPLDGYLRVAAMVDIGGRSATINPKRIAILRDHVAEILGPHADDESSSWAGLRPATPTGMPIIGRHPAYDNVWLNLGHGALGFTLACGSAALLNTQITGVAPAIDAQAFRPRQRQ